MPVCRGQEHHNRSFYLDAWSKPNGEHHRHHPTGHSEGGRHMSREQDCWNHVWGWIPWGGWRLRPCIIKTLYIYIYIYIYISAYNNSVYIIYIYIYISVYFFFNYIIIYSCIYICLSISIDVDMLFNRDRLSARWRIKIQSLAFRSDGRSRILASPRPSRNLLLAQSHIHVMRCWASVMLSGAGPGSM